MADRLIAIDLDGTIEDSRVDMVSSARRVRAALALPPRPDSALLPYVNGGMDQLYRACFDDFLALDPENHYARVRATYEADYLANVMVETRMYPGSRPRWQRCRSSGSWPASRTSRSISRGSC